MEHKGKGRTRAKAPSERTAFGRDVERRVSEALEQRGRIVIGRNVRVGRDEIDVLVMDGATLVLVEVRARSNASWTDAMQSVRPAKVKRLKRAALALLAKRDEQRELRIDVVAVGVDGVEVVENAVDFSET
jgi:putative endonuclease